MDIREVLAINLKKSRQAQRLSQEELAHRADIDRTYISSIERRIYAASIDVVDRLARELGLEAADLLRRQARTATPLGGAPSAEGKEQASCDSERAADREVDNKRRVRVSSNDRSARQKSSKKKRRAP